MKGAWASRAKRRAISVLPTPVGPIIRIFFGAISSRRSSATCWRRQRLRSAMATARLALCWPMMSRSSSERIAGGVVRCVAASSGGTRSGVATIAMLKLLNHDLVVGKHTNRRSSMHGLQSNGAGIEVGMSNQDAGSGEGKVSARTDSQDAIVGFEDVAVAGDQ